MGTQYKGTSEEISSLNTYIKLVRAADSILTRVYTSPHMDGLTVSQFGVIEAIYHLGPMFQRELASKILKSSGNITMVVDNLEKRGLVERKRDRDDRRYVTVYLTRKGEEMIDKILPEHVARITRELSILSEKEKEQLASLSKIAGRGVR